ncbi:MAG: C-terminal binding protein [Lentisphaerae bacterium]|nr:C-terminal binding protein [Lentisphaerota bacterium]MBT4821444.1 C-terminal binding protein [Lentisphaerota bacterium]MBT5607816.1 C-terminal binding protein [Lentisphaerota bacterium]MBT7057841.1 C-terminal binding protein [Lentisphaerota bacterium]MBT7841119.1 C-terminal binding protein [Lentisphaerota bacterium]
MANLKVVVTDYVFESFDLERGVLASVPADLVVLQASSASELIPHIDGVHALLNTYLPGMDATVFDAAPELRAVVRYGIGLDTIDVPAATERGIMVANVPDYCVDEVADHALAHFLNLARKISLADGRVKKGEWSLGYVKPLVGIADMTVGVIGFGRIGRAIASRLKPFGAGVVFHDPMVSETQDGCEAVSLEQIYTDCDAIFVQCPAVPETHHLLNREAFEAMAKRPILVNAARGSIVDTDAVVWALENDLIAGAGLDVLEDEHAVLETDHPLKAFENVTLTPHSAWYSAAAIRKLQQKAAEEVARALRGERPLSLANPEVLEK